MEEVQKVVTELFIATDQRDWTTIAACFAPIVSLDYGSMTGQPAAELKPAEIIDSWKGILPGFTHTHHQLGNFVSSIEGEKATVFCYGTATHYLEDKEGNIWTVVGTYDFELNKHAEGSWQISKMKFNFKYQDGNTSLPEKAMALAKK